MQPTTDACKGFSRRLCHKRKPQKTLTKRQVSKCSTLGKEEDDKESLIVSEFL